MNHKKKVKKIFLISLAILIISLISEYIVDYYKLYYKFETDILQALFFFPLFLVILSTVLFFTREQVFRSWLRFAKWYLPIAAILILISSDTGGGLFIGFGGGYDREGMIWFTAGLFLIISLLLIATKSWKLRGK